MATDGREYVGSGILRDAYGRRQMVAVPKHQVPDGTDLHQGAVGITDADGREEVVFEQVRVVSEAPLNLLDPRFGGKGDGVTAEDAALTTAKALMPTNGGEILLPPRNSFKFTNQVHIPDRVELIGGGGLFGSNYEAPTTLISSYDGVAVLLDGAAGSKLKGIGIKGDRSLANQDLVQVGTGSAMGTARLEDVGISNAGRDGLVLDFCLDSVFDHVRVDRSKRHNLRTSHNSNANTFISFICREADQWGAYFQGGNDLTFISPVFESNSRDAVTSYGGIYVVSDVWSVGLNLISPHFENNVGLAPALGGVPIRVAVPAAHGGGPTFVETSGATYSETNPLDLLGGSFDERGLRSQIQPVHAVVASTHEGSFWSIPRRWGTGASSNGAGSFGLTDNSGKSVVMGAGITAAKAGLMLGGDTVLTRDAANTWRIETGDQLVHDGAAASTIVRLSRVTGNSQAQHYDRVDGLRVYGDGASAQDATFGRTAADTLSSGSGDTLVGHPLRTDHVAGATPTGGSSGDIKVGTGKIWVNDAGTWKSVAIA